MKQNEILELSESLLKGCIVLYDMVTDNDELKALLCLSADTKDGIYTVKIEFEPKEGESDENE